MTPQDIIDATNTFGRYGVPEENIFQEVMRARYLDYFLFSNSSNAQYGISIEDLYENMKKTADRLGLYEGDADTYARVYTLALRVDPMAFAPGAGTARQEVRALLKEAGKKAEEAGQTILFSGAENYLPVLDDLFKDLTTKRIALAMNSPEWKEKLHMVFPRGRMMMEEELDADTEAYNYIFNWETSSIAHAASITRRLSEKGTMDVLIPYALLLEDSEEVEDARKALAAEGKLVSYYDTDLGGKEYAFLRFAGEKSPAVSFGESGFEAGAFHGYDTLKLSSEDFAAADDWNIDIYAYNGSPALQSILAGNILDLDHSIGKVFEGLMPGRLSAGYYDGLSAEGISDSGIRKDLISSAPAEEGDEGIAVRSGDLVITVRDGSVKTAVIPEGTSCVLAPGILALRPSGRYTSWYLKLYLDGPVGQLFLNTMKAGYSYHLITERILRLPLPKADDMVIREADALCRKTAESLAKAEEAWRNAKRDSVALMMGHGQA